MSPRQVGVAVIAVVVALGVGVVLGRGSGSPDDSVGTATTTAAAEPPPAGDQQDASLPHLTPLADDEDAAAAQAAIEAFLAAEVADDFEASFDRLSPADAEEFGPPAGWRQQHADFAGIAGFEVIEVGTADDGVVALVDLQLESVLNEFVGLVPARAVGAYALAQADGAWGVVFSDSTISPRYPDDSGVVADATAWVAAMQDCQEPASVYSGRIYGAQDVLTTFCDAEGPVTVSDVRPLADDSDVAALISAFGPDVLRWGREVTVESPVTARLALAPVDDRWDVIGVFGAN